MNRHDHNDIDVGIDTGQAMPDVSVRPLDEFQSFDNNPSWLLVRIAIGFTIRIVFFPVFPFELFDVHFIDCPWIKTSGIDAYSFWV